MFASYLGIVEEEELVMSHVYARKRPVLVVSCRPLLVRLNVRAHYLLNILHYLRVVLFYYPEWLLESSVICNVLCLSVDSIDLNGRKVEATFLWGCLKRLIGFTYKSNGCSLVAEYCFVKHSARFWKARIVALFHHWRKLPSLSYWRPITFERPKFKLIIKATCCTFVIKAMSYFVSDNCSNPAVIHGSETSLRFFLETRHVLKDGWVYLGESLA